MTPSSSPMNAAEALLGPSLAAGRGDSPAILFGDRVVTYGQLDAEANAFANACADQDRGASKR